MKEALSGLRGNRVEFFLAATCFIDRLVDPWTLGGNSLMPDPYSPDGQEMEAIRVQGPGNLAAAGLIAPSELIAPSRGDSTTAEAEEIDHSKADPRLLQRHSNAF